MLNPMNLHVAAKKAERRQQLAAVPADLQRDFARLGQAHEKTIREYAERAGMWPHSIEALIEGELRAVGPVSPRHIEHYMVEQGIGIDKSNVDVAVESAMKHLQATGAITAYDENSFEWVPPQARSREQAQRPAPQAMSKRDLIEFWDKAVQVDRGGSNKGRLQAFIDAKWTEAELRQFWADTRRLSWPESYGQTPWEFCSSVAYYLDKGELPKVDGPTAPFAAVKEACLLIRPDLGVGQVPQSSARKR